MAIKGRVLIIEDEEKWQDRLRRYLVQSDDGDNTYDVEVVGSYEEAKEALKRARECGRPFSVVTADLKLPESKDKPVLSRDYGKDLLKELARSAPDTFLVIVSGETLLQNELYEFFPLNVSYFFSKEPFDRKVFRKTISQLIEKVRLGIWSLPNHRIIEDQMRSLISEARQEEDWVILGVSIKNIEHIVEHYGFLQCAATLHLVGTMLTEIVDDVTPLAFVSMIPFSDFIIVTTSNKVELLKEKLLQEFDERAEQIEAIAYDFEWKRSGKNYPPKIDLLFSQISKGNISEIESPDITDIVKMISSTIAKTRKSQMDNR